ncbi:MAG: FecR domain-containing protein [Bacteroidales bacterium]|nr:FecR domain-containing protein [Bacteroidales bacterium]
MNQDNRHIDNPNDPDRLSNLFFSGAKIPWKKSKAEVWQDLEELMTKEDRSPELVRRFLPGKQWLALAASLVLLLSVTGFMKFYSMKTFCPQGVHTSLQLPDGSKVDLNASTHLTYHPYWWFISRQVKLEGEAFFRVEKGNKFQVVSSSATTEVLGTTFNVFARGEDYIVTCHTGSVRVTEAISGSAVTLSPNERGVMEHSGGFNVTQVESSRTSPGWTGNLIMFASTPLRLVFDEIERQYDIVIETPEVMQQLYSGNFSLDQPVEIILSLLCLPFDLAYERQTGKKYLVYPSME